MRQPESQDRLDIFKKSITRTIDWKTFFELDTDQRASAELLLDQKNIISLCPHGTYEVSPGIRGIVPASRAPAYFTDEQEAKSLLKFYQSNNIQASIRGPNYPL